MRGASYLQNDVWWALREKKSVQHIILMHRVTWKWRVPFEQDMDGWGSLLKLGSLAPIYPLPQSQAHYDLWRVYADVLIFTPVSESVKYNQVNFSQLSVCVDVNRPLMHNSQELAHVWIIALQSELFSFSLLSLNPINCLYDLLWTWRGEGN